MIRPPSSIESLGVCHVCACQDLAVDAAARFDGDRTFALVDCVAELVADRPEDVVGVLDAAESAAARGAWVAGWVAYDAAPGLDAALPARRGGVPLAWFGVFARQTEAAALPYAGEEAVWSLDATEAEHRRQVGEVKRLIRAGQAYQVNLTTRAHARVDDVAGVYAGMIAAQRPGYGALIEAPTHAVACASPELFFALEGSSITTRPMKGTARRGRWPDEDLGQREALRASAKERAENVMIVDLLRNDVGRVATFGSVEVPALFDIERYPTVWQMTSTVRGTLRPDTGLTGVFKALFPSGSVTGAPKRSAMQCIADLEPPRGVYCGAVGHIEPGLPLRATFAVAIRTLTVDRASARAEYGAGGGITWPSDPAAEWRELTAKVGILAGRPTMCGLFETMRGDGHNRSRHLDRMEASAEYAGVPFDRAAATALVEGQTTGRLRLDLNATGGLHLTTGAMPVDGSVRLAFSDEPVDSTDVRLFHKLSDRAGYERRRAAHPDADDVILTNERGEVTETTIGNLAVRIDGRWWTPPLDCGLLPGVERARLLDKGVLGERVIRPDELDEVAVVSSLRGWRPATIVPPRPATSPAPPVPADPPSGSPTTGRRRR